jgi:hydrogenase expression/formation protein HypC
MCVAFPGEVIEKKGDYARVDFNGNISKVNVKLVPANIGDFVLVHAGYATSVIDKIEEKNMLEIFSEL